MSRADDWYLDAPRSSAVCLTCERGVDEAGTLCPGCIDAIGHRAAKHSARAFRLPLPPRTPALEVPAAPPVPALPVFATPRERAYPVAERVPCGEAYDASRETVRARGAA